jgi:hypothetical protein
MSERPGRLCRIVNDTKPRSSMEHVLFAAALDNTLKASPNLSNWVHLDLGQHY